MNISQALEYIHSIPKFVRPLGNAGLAGLLDALSNPHERLRFIHIAGTNGKGSTAAMTAEILRRAGFRTGLFTSPFIEIFNERIKINGENIPDSDLAALTAEVKAAAEEGGHSVSEFAFITAMAFLYFYRKKCGYVVLETGMGGRLDATNIIPVPEVSAITSISLDHMQYLGGTLEEIAAEKCGIIKENGIAVAYPNDSVMSVIENHAAQLHAELIKCEKAVPSENGGFIYKGREYPLALKGEYQPQNAALVIEIINVLRRKGAQISDKAVFDGLSNVTWPARFEFLSDRLIIDGGHNIDGIRALKRSLLSLGRPVIIVMAMMQDKMCAECVAELAPAAKHFIATELDMPRCLDAESLLSMAGKGECVVPCAKAVQKALDLADTNDVVCVCGSLYLAGEIRKKFK